MSPAVLGITSLSKAERKGWGGAKHIALYIKEAKRSWKTQQPSPSILLAKLLRFTATPGSRGNGGQGCRDEIWLAVLYERSLHQQPHHLGTCGT